MDFFISLGEATLQLAVQPSISQLSWIGAIARAA
jgi:hypothetical protein